MVKRHCGVEKPLDVQIPGIKVLAEDYTTIMPTVTRTAITIVSKIRNLPEAFKNEV